jgi:hypothetical protein
VRIAAYYCIARPNHPQSSLCCRQAALLSRIVHRNVTHKRTADTRLPTFRVFNATNLIFHITHNTMPLSASEKEGKYVLALNMFHNSQSQTINAAATAYNVNHKTLITCSNVPHK